MSEHETERSKPSVKSFDPWKLPQPDDGIVYLYRSFVDGFWRVINDEDIALQEATGYPVGELVEQESMGEYDDSECGELRAIYVPSSDSDPERFEDAEMAVSNARGLLSDFEEVSVEVKHGSIEHAIAELQNARRALPDDY